MTGIPDAATDVYFAEREFYVEENVYIKRKYVDKGDYAGNQTKELWGVEPIGNMGWRGFNWSPGRSPWLGPICADPIVAYVCAETAGWGE